MHSIAFNAMNRQKPAIGLAFLAFCGVPTLPFFVVDVLAAALLAGWVVDFVAETLKNIDKKEFEAKKFVSYKDQFQAFLFAGFLLILLELFLFETKTKWVQRLNLFNEK